MTNDILKNAQTSKLNDLLRQTLLTGKVELSEGVQALPTSTQQKLLDGVKNFATFAPQDDNFKERDYGAFECGEHDIFWLIDYYDEDSHYLSDDPANLEKTNRVLRIMLVEEYGV